MLLRQHSIMGGVLLKLFSSALSIVLIFSSLQTQAVQAQEGQFQRISAGSSGVGGGCYASLSADGRYVTFESSAADLASKHLNNSWDTVIRDQMAGTFELVSSRSDGMPVFNEGDYTAPPRISGNGRYVVFISRAEDLVAGDDNGMPDVFRKDRSTGQTVLVSITPAGKSSNSDSYNPAISADGRYVAFLSYSSNLVANDTNDSPDFFVRDMLTGITERVSVTNSGQQGSDPQQAGGFSSIAISDNGQYVAFSYQSLPISGTVADQPNIYLRDRVTKTTQWIAPGEFPALTGSGRYLAFVSSAALVPADTNNVVDVYLLDREQTSPTFERISVSSSGKQADSQAVLSAPAISADGMKIAFESSAGSLVTGDDNGQNDIFLRSRSTGVTQLVTVSPVGGSGNGTSYGPAISADGSAIAFCSSASNFVQDDTNNRYDVFVTGSPALSSSFQPVRLFIPILSH